VAESDRYMQQEEMAKEPSSNSWLFYKAIGAVFGGLVLLVLILSPKLYIPSLRNTKEVCFKRAEAYLNEEKLDEAVEAYENVLRFEKARERLFMVAENKIKKIKELQRIQQQDGDESGDIEAAKDPTGRGEADADDETTKDADAIKTEDEMKKADKDEEETDEDGAPNLDGDI
jgi:hypothetical protein